MGLSDRDYFRQEEQTKRSPIQKFSAVAVIIILNFVLYLMDQLSGGVLFHKLALVGSCTSEPLQWYRCLTYGFAHDPSGFLHILCNMLVLFFFGPPLERIYGKSEFTLIYLASILVGGIIWNVLHFNDESMAALGASGGITTLVILFAMNYPHSQILLYGILPLPAWLAGVLFILYDLFGMKHGIGNVAYDIHLSGAIFAVIYFLSNIKLSALFFHHKKMDSRPNKAPHLNLNLHKDLQGDNRTVREKGTNVVFEHLEAEVDRILLKISATGEGSLTEEERNTLRVASQEYQKRKK